MLQLLPEAVAAVLEAVLLGVPLGTVITLEAAPAERVQVRANTHVVTEVAEGTSMLLWTVLASVANFATLLAATVVEMVLPAVKDEH
jgi:hypothetical protein